MKNRNQKILSMVEMAMLVALVVVLQLFGGMIKILFLPFSFSLVLIPIVIGSILLSYKHGAALGFKGIFARWARYYITETGDMNLLLFLQHNADIAYDNRNESGLIFTNWKDQTPADPVAEGHNAFSMCTAVSLFYNCQIWE